MKLLVTLALALAPLRAHANGRLTRYARNATSHPGRCDRNVFERQFYDLAKGLKPTLSTSSGRSSATVGFTLSRTSKSAGSKVTAGKK